MTAMICPACKKPVTYLKAGGRGVRYHVHSLERGCDLDDLTSMIDRQVAKRNRK